MAAGYCFCRKCGYDFVSNGPHDRVCEDCCPRPAPRRRATNSTPSIPTPVVVDLSPEACAARWATMSCIVKGVRFTPH